MDFATFPEIWAVDTEFKAPPGEVQEPVCLAALDLKSGRRVELWRDELAAMPSPPFHPDALIVSYQAMAEIGTYLSLSWPTPRYVVCMYAEFRRHRSGCEREGDGQFSEIGALKFFGLPHMETAHKQAMRDLIIERPWSEIEAHRGEIQRYCMEDVEGLARLFGRMHARGAIDLSPALVRGRFQVAAAHVERAGYPIDAELWAEIHAKWNLLELGLIRERDNLGVYDQQDGTFNRKRWLRACREHGIDYPTRVDGSPVLKRSVREQVAAAHPVLQPVHELMETLGQMRDIALPVGRDGRVRTPVMPFGTNTGRCAPSTTKNIFGASSWVRRLIVAAPGRVVFQLDYSKQEPWIGAALSGDEALLADLQSKDLYVAFSIRNRSAPSDLASPDEYDESNPEHAAARTKAKACVLGIGYLMGPRSLAQRLGCSTAEGRAVLASFREAYPKYAAFVNGMARTAMLRGEIRTMLGWRQRVYQHTRFRSLANFAQQATGAEMLRLATIFAVEDGLRPIALVHDCIVFEAPLGKVDLHVARAQGVMADASRSLIGFEIPTDGQVVVTADVLAGLPADDKGRRYMNVAGVHLPANDRLQSGKGGAMWETILRLLRTMR